VPHGIIRGPKVEEGSDSHKTVGIAPTVSHIMQKANYRVKDRALRLESYLPRRQLAVLDTEIKYIAGDNRLEQLGHARQKRNWPIAFKSGDGLSGLGHRDKQRALPSHRQVARVEAKVIQEQNSF